MARWFSKGDANLPLKQIKDASRLRSPSPLAVLLPALVLAAEALGGTPYVLIDAAAFVNGQQSNLDVKGIDDSGMVFGHIRLTGQNNRVYYWTANDGFATVPTPDGRSVFAQGMNHVGVGVGYYSLSSHLGGFRWTRAGGYEFFPPTVPGAIDEAWVDINDAGAVCGSFTLSGASRGFIRSPGGVFTILQPLAGATQCGASAINSAGFAAGQSNTASFPNEYVSVLWAPDGSIQSLGTLLDGEGSSAPLDMNASNVVVGFGDSKNYERPFRWDALNGMVDIYPTAPHLTRAFAINDPGQIVGYLTDGTGNVMTPLLWDASGTRHDIYTLIPPAPGITNIHPVAINSRGWIAGGANSPNGNAHVIVIRPACHADLNGDAQVGAADLAFLLGAWGDSGAPDLSGDGVVGAADLALLLGAWGPCP